MSAIETQSYHMFSNYMLYCFVAHEFTEMSARRVRDQLSVARKHVSWAAKEVNWWELVGQPSLLVVGFGPVGQEN